VPRPFRRIDVAEFAELIRLFDFKRRVTSFHVHHTWIPRRSQFKGLASIEAMERDHRLNRHFSDIAQHITLDPNGAIWTGRSWNAAPASATGFNGNSKAGPFMMEMIGNFDKNEEPFDGAQAANAYRIVAIVLRRFGLTTDAIRFHNEMSEKTCPGSAIVKSYFVEQVKKALAELPKAASLNESERGVLRDAVSGLLEPLGEAAARTDAVESEPSEEEETYDQYVARRAAETGEDFARGADDLSLTELMDLVPHVVNLRRGQFEEDDLFISNKGTVDAIFAGLDAQLNDASVPKPLKLMFYAHGGLNSEAGSLKKAHRDLFWWKLNGVYPIFFIWHTDLGSAIGDILRRHQAARGVLDKISEKISDAADRVIEEMLHATVGIAVWDSMKFSAAEASTGEGGAKYVAGKVSALVAAHAGKVELHAVGHSAGVNFHSHFINATQVPFASLQMLAPAIRIDEYKQRLDPIILDSTIKTAKIYTMRDKPERDDDCARIYHKSLLYLISRGLEIKRDEPILGLERFLTKDPQVAERFGVSPGPNTRGEVIFAPSAKSTAKKHGAFDDDIPTMNNVAAVIRGSAASPSYAAAATALAVEDPFAPRELPPDLAPLLAPQQQRLIDVTPSSRGGGRRRAICVGINAYPTAALTGCVADAQLWAKTLVAAGFEPPTMLLDSLATRQAIIDTLARTLAGSVPGDVVVFQFSGHGTEVDDFDGDELAAKDQALCPVDFADGHFLIDDDIAELFKKIPAGVDVTCFLDNCFSGTATRFAIGRASTLAGANDLPRFVIPTDEMLRKHENFRRTLGFAPRRATSRGPASMREVVFSACKPDELAWESNGQGDFTRNAVALLRANASISNERFQDQLTTGFTPAGRQHPTLDCAPAAKAASLFGFGLGAPTPAPPPQPQPQPHSPWNPHSISAQLRQLAESIDRQE
jgi:Caspase domain/N-acetylmuramoyl-L-alanine amidase